MENDKPYRYPFLRLSLIGYPIRHSQSPEIFRPYCPYDLIETPTFEMGFEQFLQGDYLAANITTPFKETALAYADHADETATLLQATNLLIKGPDGIRATNTDYSGVLQLLRQHLGNTQQGNVLIIGCGGAGKAATAAALTFASTTWKTGHIYLANRHPERAEAFIHRLKHSSLASSAPISLENRSISLEALPFSRIPDLWSTLQCIILALPTVDAQSAVARMLQTADFSRKIVLEANYRNPLLAQKNIPQYLGGRLWLQAQAQPLLELVLLHGRTV